MKRLVVVGASGLIGSHLLALARQMGQPAVGTCCRNRRQGLTFFDLRVDHLRDVFPDLSADDVVCLLAAYSDPSWIFAHQEEAFSLNVEGSKRLIDEVTGIGARLVFMSSVEVFDGADGNYAESGVPRPLNLYGRMKLEIERYLQAKPGRNCLVRTGWNVGGDQDHRCVVALTYETLLRPGARMARDNRFSVIDVRDTARGLLRVCADEGLSCCHLAADPPLLRTELAELVKRTSRYGERMAYEVVDFAEIPYTEARGRNNNLDGRMARHRFGLEYLEPEEIILEKVAYLDRQIHSGRAANLEKGR